MAANVVVVEEAAGAAVPGRFGSRAFQLLYAVLQLHHRVVARCTPNEPFWSLDDLSGARELERHWAEIAAEFAALRADRDPLDVEQVVDASQGIDGRWDAYFLIDEGRTLGPAAMACPQTVRLARGVRGMRGAMFSVMTPGTELAPHVGHNKAILRVHLTLAEPDPPGAAGIEVEGRVHRHRAGAAFAFDDTFVHRAWNHGTTERPTLMLEVRRPIPWWLRPLDAAVQLTYRFHPMRRQTVRRLRELDAAVNG